MTSLKNLTSAQLATVVDSLATQMLKASVAKDSKLVASLQKSVNYVCDLMAQNVKK